jgi:hypothetical protein
MKLTDVAQAIKDCRTTKEPVFLWGPPGIGKSEIVAQVARDLKIPMIDFRVALRDPTDFKGFPMPDTKRNTMTFFRDEELPRDGEGILFLDELNTGAQLVQNVAMQLCLPPYRIGNYQLPPGWSIVAAGNRETDRGVANRIPTTVASRLVHIDVEPDVEDFISYLMDNADVGSPELIAFLRFKSAAFFTFDPKSANRTFACPRTWVKADKLRKHCTNPKVAYDLIKGTVGEGEGTDYWSFIKLINELPSVDTIKLNPDTAPIPEGMGGQVAITTTLASHTADGQAFGRFMKYISRMSVEFQAVYVRDVLRRTPAVKQDSTFTKWALKNEKVIV